MGEPIFIDYSIGFDNIIFLLNAVFMKSLKVDTIVVNISNKVSLKDINNVINLVRVCNKNIKLIFSNNDSIINVDKSENGIDQHVVELIKEFGYEINKFSQVMVNRIKEGNERVNIISTGSLSNISKMFLAYPEIKKSINKVIIVGGAIYGGNCTPCAESNIFKDPYAADIVFNSGLPISMCALDVTEKACLNEKEIDEILFCLKSIKNKNITDYIKNEVISFFKTLKISNKPLSNLCGLIYALNSDIFKSESCLVDVETGGEFTYGCTVVDINHVSQKPKNVDVLYSLEVEKFSLIIKDFFVNL